MVWKTNNIPVDGTLMTQIDQSQLQRESNNEKPQYTQFDKCRRACPSESGHCLPVAWVSPRINDSLPIQTMPEVLTSNSPGVTPGK